MCKSCNHSIGIMLNHGGKLWYCQLGVKIMDFIETKGEDNDIYTDRFIIDKCTRYESM